MTYYPKNKIQTNLYTSGNEFVYLSNKQPYVGSYYKLYNGKFFTGASPNDKSSLELIKLAPPGIDPELGVFGGLNPEGSLNVPYNPLFPTSQDYQNGEFTRYFLIRRNQLLFSEINKNVYDDYISKKPTVYWRTYRPFSLKWQLTGDISRVAQVNKDITSLIELRENVTGLSMYLQENWIQYYKFTKAENLTTDGKGDFVLKTINGNLYGGEYHIDPNKGYIAGPTPNKGSQIQLYGYYKDQPITTSARSSM
jgi:hypothetical protein